MLKFNRQFVISTLPVAIAFPLAVAPNAVAAQKKK